MESDNSPTQPAMTLDALEHTHLDHVSIREPLDLLLHDTALIVDLPQISIVPSVSVSLDDATDLR